MATATATATATTTTKRTLEKRKNERVRCNNIPRAKGLKERVAGRQKGHKPRTRRCTQKGRYKLAHIRTHTRAPTETHFYFVPPERRAEPVKMGRDVCGRRERKKQRGDDEATRDDSRALTCTSESSFIPCFAITFFPWVFPGASTALRANPDRWQDVNCNRH
jgi:hypothetical protein